MLVSAAIQVLHILHLPSFFAKSQPHERVWAHWIHPPHGALCHCDGCRVSWNSPVRWPKEMEGDMHRFLSSCLIFCSGYFKALPTLTTSNTSPAYKFHAPRLHQQHAFLQVGCQCVHHQRLSRATRAAKHQDQAWPGVEGSKKNPKPWKIETSALWEKHQELFRAFAWLRFKRWVQKRKNETQTHLSTRTCTCI